jgi:hypothetical protein
MYSMEGAVIGSDHTVLAKQESDQRIARIIKDYTECIGYLNDFFSLVYDDGCRECIETSTVCCCVGGFEYVGGPASDKIDEMRDELYAKAVERGARFDGYCGHLDLDSGCVISELKSPTCAVAFCHGEKVEEKYGIEYDMDDLRKELEYVLADCEKGDKCSIPVANQDRIQEFKDYLKDMIGKVENVQGKP